MCGLYPLPIEIYGKWSLKVHFAVTCITVLMSCQFILKPLRERSDDILPLTKLFLEKYNVRYKTHKSLSPAVKSYFLSYPWPGNVRELMHTVERLLIISDSDIIGMDAVKSSHGE